ncbi:Fe2+-dependent dioxygenase [Azoarcus indigens]|uniref:PKHD-type hydroxylase n=1 Tax=Azoarcus indigens TaxID=29545 RepID=A0A4R6DU36_9RHOO|nr:Fe2+-dependent dioxygenase [Azoarcus indigens]NMG67115.1 Fe2+-dependent dioxygenase [Azoarcus indigens]TDN48706.1 PKHD-type hydroxylase [Azoarcus indigens]
MMLHVPEVLTRDELAECRQLLFAADWENGLVTAGAQAAQVKRNRQLPENTATLRRLREIVTAALMRNPLFFSAALPNRILPPYFNRYEGGEEFGNHVDNAIRRPWGSEINIRSDVSTTLFFTDPDEYEGGDLIVEDSYGTHSAKLPAGDAIVYPSTSLHRVEPVTAGARVCSFLWTQSMVRDDWKRNMMFDLDCTIQKLRARVGDNEEVVALTSHYHNLLRMWAEV